MVGSNSGAVKRLNNNCEPAGLIRTITKAAGIPISSDRTVTTVARTRLTRKASAMLALRASSAYQRTPQLCGGNTITVSALNESGNTSTTGASK